MVEEKLTAIMIIEVAGRPPQYLIDSMKAHIDKLNTIKGVRLVSSKISEPAIVESEKDLYTCFAEVEVQTDGLAKLMDLMFDFMPSSVEIIEPIDLQLNCQEATMFMNDLSGRLHRYDEVTKIMQMQLQQMAAKLSQMQQGQQKSAQQNPIQPVQITMQQNAPEKETKKPLKKSSKKKKK
jgi:hypothetical protein